jgi:hypothetical protein
VLLKKSMPCVQPKFPLDPSAFWSSAWKKGLRWFW